MKLNLFSAFCLLLLFCQVNLLRSQDRVHNNQPILSAFQDAYHTYPSIPKGLLEAVSYHNTRMTHLIPSEMSASCSGMPIGYGIMGLFEEGGGVFRNNLAEIADLSGMPADLIKIDMASNILAYSAAFDQLAKLNQVSSNDLASAIDLVAMLSEFVPGNDIQHQYPIDVFKYGIYSFLNNKAFQQLYNFPDYRLDGSILFGDSNFAILSSARLSFSADQIISEEGNVYGILKAGPCYDVPGVLWVTSPNYSSRSGTAISAVTIHTMQGSYSGSISWFQNTSASASAHYMIRSSDGQITQMVCEADKGWHVGSENPYTIGLEHEGYIDNASWYTTAMYTASANIVKDIVNSGYGINPLRMYHGLGCSGSTTTCGLGACTKIKGHQQFPNQSHTDPGPLWNWDYYYNLVNNNPTITNYITSTGSFTDGGGTANYANDVRQVVKIAPPGATSITITFNAFNTELNYDYLYIYDGSSYTSPLIGRYHGTTLPASITSTGGSLLFDFRTDCATTAPGFDIAWTAQVIDTTSPNTAIQAYNWVTGNFTCTFTDTDNSGGSGIYSGFYQVSDYDGTKWSSLASQGFYNDEFSGTTLGSLWTSPSGVWGISSGAALQSDEANSNTNTYSALTQNLSNSYLYHWQGTITGTGTNKRAGLHFFANTPSAANRGISYFVYFRDDGDKVQLYEVDATDAYTLVKETNCIINTGQSYDCKVFYDRITGKIQVYVNNVFITDWTDTTPISNGTHISFRSGNCQYKVDDLRVYRSRTSTPTITVGTTASQLRYQSANATTNAGKIRSLAKDVAGNISNIATEDLLVDYTTPSTPTISSGTITYNSTTAQYTSTLGWTAATDANSGIANYRLQIGTTSGGSNFMAATNIGNVTSYTLNNPAFVSGTTYYYTISSVNGAGLISNSVTATGQTAGCSTPSNLFVTNLTATGAKLNWSSVSHKQYYQVKMKKSTTSSWTYYSNLTTNYKSFTSITPNTIYQWAVRTQCVGGTWTAWTTTQSFTTPLLLEDNNDDLYAHKLLDPNWDMTITPSIIKNENPIIEFTEEIQDGELVVTALNGQVVHTTKINGNYCSVNCRELHTGMYLITVYYNNSRVTKRILVE